ncbi:MAG TPA: flagellar hook-associated protein FlgK [Devosiaceae bacterium]|jgi:flagellar hook-associated protein 1 FlgK
MGLGIALGNALSGLSAGNSSLEVLSRNISNAGTPGYHKQSMELLDKGSTGNSYVLQGGVVRAFNATLQASYNTQVADSSYASVMASYMDQLQTYMGKVGDSGSLDSVYNDFQTALKGLAASPDDYTARAQVVTNAQSLAGTLNRLSGQLQDMRQNTESAMTDSVNQLNQNLDTLKDVNARLSDFGTDDTSRQTLLDQRDRLVGSIAEQIDITASYRGDGSVALMTRSGVSLMDVKTAQFSFSPAGSLSATSQFDMDSSQSDVGTLTITTPSGATMNLVEQDVVKSGALGALIDLRDNTLPTAQSQLDEIASGLAQAFSTNQTAGTPTSSGGADGYTLDLSGSRGGNDLTFTYTENGKAKNARIVNVDDASKLPMDYVDADGTRVIGANFADGANSVAGVLNSKFGGKLSFSGTGSSLTMLDDGAAGKIDIKSATVRNTSSGTQDGGLGLSLFVDSKNADYTNSLKGNGEKLGFASRISVNSDVLANNSLLVQYDGSTPMGDTKRADYLNDQLNSMHFVSTDRTTARQGNFSISGNVGDLISQTINYQGNTVADAMANDDTQSQSMDALSQRMDGEYGVNVDDEMSRLMQLQNAYAANAHVVSVVQELLQNLMEM